MKINSYSPKKKTKQNKFAVNLEKLKSKYILQNIFNICSKYKSLLIVKYNKKIQNRLDIGINDYKEYSGTFTPIEIEIVPDKYEFGKFINEIFVPYCHIYFDDNMHEIKRNFINYQDKISKIKIILDYRIKSFENLFLSCRCIEIITFKKMYRNNITNMRCMFYDCKSLKEINLSNFHTENVTDMSKMFCLCTSLKELNISNFNTKNVTNMSEMFNGCESLYKLDLSNFNTENVTDMHFMFHDCVSLRLLDISSFNTSKVTRMNGMFSDCSSLKDINISHFNFDKIESIVAMFRGCKKELTKKIRQQNDNMEIEAFYDI